MLKSQLVPVNILWITSGRILVGLRWWNYVDSEGQSNWVYEARKVSTLMKISYWSLYQNLLLVGGRFEEGACRWISSVLGRTYRFSYILGRAVHTGPVPLQFPLASGGLYCTFIEWCQCIWLFTVQVWQEHQYNRSCFKLCKRDFPPANDVKCEYPTKYSCSCHQNLNMNNETDIFSCSLQIFSRVHLLQALIHRRLWFKFNNSAIVSFVCVYILFFLS